MKRLTLTLAALLTLCASASAAYYVPKAHTACKAHYVKRTVKIRERRHGRFVRKHGRIVWVKQVRCVYVAPPKPPPPPGPGVPAPTIHYTAMVDPSFNRGNDPLRATYQYSAAASSPSNANLGASGQLPPGVLNFYSPTSPGQPAGLVCSMNVGGSTTGGSCPVQYSQTGTYNVTTEYIPNAASAVTQTDAETISPYTTTTTLPYVSSGNSGCSCSTNAYTPTVTDQNGNVVPFNDQNGKYVGNVTFVIGDSTTGQSLPLSDPYGPGQAVNFYRTTVAPSNQEVCVSGTSACTAAFANGSSSSDSFTVQAIYQPPGSNYGWSGSSSPVTPLPFS